MKKILPVLALLLLGSCSKPLTAIDRCEVEFRALSPGTRSGDERRIGTLDLLVFDAGSGQLDSRVRAGGSGIIKVSLRKDVPLHWWIIANAPEGILDGYCKESDFRQGINSHIRDDSGLFTMFDWGTVIAPCETIDVALDRYSCKVSLNGLSVPYLETLDRTPLMSIGTIMLMNAPEAIMWSGTPIDDGYSIILSDSDSIPVSLYCMPNGSEGTPAKIAIELLFDGIPNWYTLNLPPMRCNRHYTIDGITIIGPGSSSPDISVSREFISFNLDINQWLENISQIEFTAYEND